MIATTESIDEIPPNSNGLPAEEATMGDAVEPAVSAAAVAPDEEVADVAAVESVLLSLVVDDDESEDDVDVVDLEAKPVCSQQ